jgi:hypothetical protein
MCRDNANGRPRDHIPDKILVRSDATSAHDDAKTDVGSTIQQRAIEQKKTTAKESRRICAAYERAMTIISG